MKVDYILILAAGKGTRMGKIGKVLPKVIWPVFNKSLLELQVAYAKHLAPKAKIFINIYYHRETVSRFVKSHPASFSDTELILERSPLDIGGAIHNMASQVNYKGNLLILNSDQFIFSNLETINSGLKLLADSNSVLFTYKVNSSDGYNALKIIDHQLQGIILNNELPPSQQITTYTGMSLVKLEELTKQKGELKFFDSVANYESGKVTTFELSNLEYWDFGTLNRYYNSLNQVCKGENSAFFDFLVKNGAIRDEERNKLDIRNLKMGELQIDGRKFTYRDIQDEVIWDE